MDLDKLKDGARELLDKFEGNQARWLLVVVGVIILLRPLITLRLVLLTAALPLFAYWQYSNRPEEDEAEGGDADGEPDDAAWHGENEDDAAKFPGDAGNDNDMDLGFGRDEDGRDPYDQAFWAGESSGRDGGDAAGATGAKRNAPWHSQSDEPKAGAKGDGFRFGDDDDLGFGSSRRGDAAGGAVNSASQDLLAGGLDGPRPGGGAGHGPSSGGPLDGLDDFGDLGGGSKRGLGSLGGGGALDFDFLGAGGGGMDDMDFGFGGGGFGDRPKGKGKGKGKGGDKGPRDPNAPREANPKQVFVANVGDMPEDDIRSFFEEVGEVDRLKVLRNPDGTSKGVCFVTFRTEDQAQKALTLHGASLDGKNLVVRLAHAGNKGKEGGKDGGGKGDRPERLGDGLPDLDRGAERFGAAFGFGGDRENRFDRGDGDRERKGGKGRGKSKGGGRNERGEIDDILEEALSAGDGPLKASDFDFAARRFLVELKNKDRTDGTGRLQEALDMVLKYTSSKDRSSVRKWPAYVFTLLQKFDPNLWDELRERDAERRREKGSGGFGGKGSRGAPKGRDDDDDAAGEAPPDDD